MYPLLKWNVVLVKQYKESYIYNLNRNEKGMVVSSNFSYEVINKPASDILELCNGDRCITDIAGLIAQKYQTDTNEAETIIKDFLFNSENKQYIEFRYRRNKEDIKVLGNSTSYTPFHAEIEITKRCPLKCKHCYNNSGDSKMDELTSEEIIQIMQDLKKSGVIKVAITGGEPTIKKGFIDICKFAANSFLAVAVMSNRYLINEELVNQLIEYKDNLTFQISIDGNEKHHNFIRGVQDSFEKACNAIKILSKKGFKVAISFTCNSENSGDIEYITNLVKQLGAIQITYGLTMDMGRASDNGLAGKVDPEDFYNKVLKLKRKYMSPGFYVNVSEEVVQNTIQSVKSNCGLGINQITIRENGDVSPCVCFFYSIGNLKRQKLSEILSIEFGETIKNLQAPNLEICSGCEKELSCSRCIADVYDSDLTRTNCKWRNTNKKELEKLEKIFVPIE